MKKYVSVIFALHLVSMKLFAWTNGELLVWMDSDRGYALAPAAKKFETEFGIKVTIESPEKITDSNAHCAFVEPVAYVLIPVSKIWSAACALASIPLAISQLGKERNVTAKAVNMGGQAMIWSRMPPYTIARTCSLA
jgi:hypothetical protein